MLTVQGKVNRDDGQLYFSFSETYPAARTLTWQGVADPADGCIKVWDDRDYIPGWPFWRRAFVNRSNGKIELQVPRYEQMASLQLRVFSGFAAVNPPSPPPDPPPPSVLYAQAQDAAYNNFLAASSYVYEDAFKHADTDPGGPYRCWFRSGGPRGYTITAAAKAGALDARLHVAGKHYYRIFTGTPPTMDRVDSGEVTFGWNEGPSNMYVNGLDFVTNHVPDASVPMSDFNGTWAASGRAWDASPIDASHRIISVPSAFITSMSGTTLNVWFLLSNTAFPWRSDNPTSAEDLGVFFGGLWVLC